MFNVGKMLLEFRLGGICSNKVVASSSASIFKNKIHFFPTNANASWQMKKRKIIFMEISWCSSHILFAWECHNRIGIVVRWLWAVAVSLSSELFPSIHPLTPATERSNLLNSRQILTDRWSFKANGILIADRTESVTSEHWIQINWKSLKLFVSLASPSVVSSSMEWISKVIKFCRCRLKRSLLLNTERIHLMFIQFIKKLCSSCRITSLNMNHGDERIWIRGGTWKHK